MKLMLSVVMIRAHDYALRFKEGILAESYWLLAYEAILVLCKAFPLPSPYHFLPSDAEKVKFCCNATRKRETEKLEIVLKLLFSSFRLLDYIK